jgi:hypothetical protein
LVLDSSSRTLFIISMARTEFPMPAPTPYPFVAAVCTSSKSLRMSSS